MIGYLYTVDVLTSNGKETLNKFCVEPPLMYTRLELTPTELHAKNYGKQEVPRLGWAQWPRPTAAYLIEDRRKAPL